MDDVKARYGTLLEAYDRLRLERDSLAAELAKAVEVLEAIATEDFGSCGMQAARILSSLEHGSYGEMFTAAQLAEIREQTIAECANAAMTLVKDTYGLRQPSYLEVVEAIRALSRDSSFRTGGK